jgi:hypothetical protein
VLPGIELLAAYRRDVLVSSLVRFVTRLNVAVAYKQADWLVQRVG